jgi:predicted signal transduction protein with EAL and GGDEF domain
LVAALAGEAALDGVTVATGASVGVAVSSGAGDDPDQLLVKADLALYRAKTEGRGGYRVFEPGMDQRLRERRALEHDLREAVAQGRLTLFYQPQADATTGEILGFEALLRWPLAARGMVPAAQFVPLAEEIGLICVLGAWVLRAACAEATGWPAGLRLGVNLSPAQFARGDLVELVERTLRETGLPAERLELEITEGVLLQHTECVLGVLDRLKRLGVRIAMDDFGTGYSSLSYLHRFPFDRIKVDRSFVADLVERPEAVSIVRAVVGLSDSLGVEVVAEGVETEGQLEALRRERCHEVQGFLIGHPMPADAVLPYLADRDAAGARQGCARP